MKKMILVKTGSQTIGIFSNLKAFWERIENRDDKAHYSTVSSYLSANLKFDAGTCQIEGQSFEAVTIQKVVVNTFLAPKNI